MCNKEIQNDAPVKLNIAKVPQCWLLGANAHTQSFYNPTACEWTMFKQILLHMVLFEYPYHLMVSRPLNLHSLE